MCARLLRHTPPERQGRLYRWSERAVRPDHRGLRHEPCAGCSATSRRRSLVAVATLGAHRDAVRGGAEGLLPGAGHRGHPGHLRSAADDLVPGDGRAAAGAGRGDPEGSGGREPVVVHRRGRHQRHAQQRADPHQPEAARPARGERERRHPPAAARAGQGRGHPALHAAGAGPHRRGSGEPHAVPVQPRGSGRRASSTPGPRGWSTRCARGRSWPTSAATSRTRGSAPRS